MNANISCHNFCDEEELIRLLASALSARITEFTCSKTKLDLHYPTEELKTHLIAAINRGNVGILETLVKKYPVELDSTRPVAKLLQCTPLMQRGWNCLYYTISGERIPNVKHLLESGRGLKLSKDIPHSLPIYRNVPVILSNLAVAKLLLDYGANFEIRDNLEYTVLRLAIRQNKQEQAMLLIERASDVKCIPSTSTYSGYELAEDLMPDLSPVVARS